MKFARLENSPRLQHLLRLLLDGDKHSTAELRKYCNTDNVTVEISELRQNGIIVNTARVEGIWKYWLPCQNVCV